MRKLLLAVAIFFATLELVLQVGAWLASESLPVPGAGAAGGASVLCLGDSYTAGVGATSPDKSYPVQLQQRLRDLGHRELTVVNGGCPGQDSAFMLKRLPGLLRAETKVVCILMAFNDTWSRPNRIDPAALVAANQTSSTFEWRWRTGRLIALCAGFAQNSWHRTSEQVPAIPAGPTGDASNAPSVIDTAAGFVMLEDLGLIAATEPLPAFAPPITEPLATRVREVEQRLLADDAEAALRLAVALTSEHPDNPYAQKALAVAAHFGGDAKQSEAALAALATMAADAGAATNECHIIALLATGHPERTLAAAQFYVTKEPRSVVAWIATQDAAYALGRWGEFRAAAPVTLRLCGRLMPPQSATIARHYAQLLDPPNGASTATLLVAATLLDGNRALSRAKVAAARDAVAWPLFGAAIDAVHPAQEGTREALRDLFRTAYDDDGSAIPWAPTLEAHMLEIGRICAQRGKKLVVLGYPFPHRELEAIQMAAAQRLGAPFVPLRERFDRELQTRPREDLFVRNGHCTDAGYAIFAELAASAIDPLLKN